MGFEMRLARFDGGRLGVVIGEEIADITAVCGGDLQQWPDMNMVRVIRDFDSLRGKIEAALPDLPRVPLTQVRLETPVPWPNKIIAYPVNYHAHGREMQAQYRATNQGFFLKPNSALSGPADPVVLPNVPGREVHHESELGIIIGKECRGVSRENWKDVVFGYTCLLDMVVRGREERVFRKAYDSFCPVGPWITTPDEISDPAALDMKLWVGDELRQSANTRDLVLDIPGMVATASAVMTLYPGDIIATGTPEGVGPVVDGDRIRIVIDQVGEMNVDVVQGEQGMTEVFAQPYVPPIIKQN
jgi:2-keto-4-pentenoate hydratase/2-oxohepta-3-ene-1,7-dioic acid hydratase in catechol pathway